MLNYAPLLPYFDQSEKLEVWLDNLFMPRNEFLPPGGVWDDKSVLLLDSSHDPTPTGKSLFAQVLTQDLTVNGYVVETLDGYSRHHIEQAVQFVFDRRGLSREDSLKAASRVTLFVVDEVLLKHITALDQLFEALPGARLLVIAYGDRDALKRRDRGWIDRHFHVTHITSPGIVPLLLQQHRRAVFGSRTIPVPKMEQTQTDGDFTPLITRLTTRDTPKARPITAHFNSLHRAVAEAHKYGATASYDAVNARIQQDGRFTHDITNARQVTISRSPGKGWTLAVAVAGTVRPVTQMPKPLFELLRQPQFG